MERYKQKNLGVPLTIKVVFFSVQWVDSFIGNDIELELVDFFKGFP